MKLRAPADTLWICGRVLRTGERPSGRVDSRWTTRSAESPSTGRFRRALPTGCPHSRASRPQPHSSATKFFLLEKEKSPNREKGTFLLCVDRLAAIFRDRFDASRFDAVRRYLASSYCSFLYANGLTATPERRKLSAGVASEGDRSSGRS